MSGFDNEVLYANNVDFTGSFPVSGQINLNGELLIGASVAPFIRAGLLTGSAGITITNGPGTINIAGTGAVSSLAFSTPSGTANSSGGAITFAQGSNVSISGVASTVTFTLTGPPSPTTLTNHGVVIGQGTSAVVATAAGSAGQVLQSGGASADPVYSTATFPSTAGTSGNVLTSDGTNWTSAAVTGPGGLAFTSAITLTSAQIKALHGTPIDIVAAPGSGKVIVPIGGICKFTYGGTNVFVAGASQIISLYYGTTQPCVGNASVTGLISNAAIVASASSYSSSTQVGPGQNIALATLENIRITAYNPIVTEISGNAGNNNTIHIAFMYYVVTL